MRRYILIIKTNIYISKNTNLTTLKMLNLFPNNIPILYYLLIQFKRTSPRKRGKKYAVWICQATARIIPAHAGKTKRCGSQKRQARDHPRSRGENCHRSLDQAIRSGSPPLTRGKPGGGVATVRVDGITPAHAGKTMHLNIPRARYRDHPRSRGENSWQPGKMAISLGSPPLTRGKPSFRTTFFGLFRITPAHAGKTDVTGIDSLRTRDHPRSRGENQ